MDEGDARLRLNKIEDELPGLLAARYPDWEISDRGTHFEAIPKPGKGGTGAQAVTAMSAVALWVALDLADAVAQASKPPAPAPGASPLIQERTAGAGSRQGPRRG